MSQTLTIDGTSYSINAQIIPLISASQSFSVTINGVQYTMQIIWRECDAQGSAWYLDLYASSGAPIVLGIPLLSGLDLMGQYDYMGLGFSLYMFSNPAGILTDATYDTLGNGNQMLCIYPA
jgi:hypothetical protein